MDIALLEEFLTLTRHQNYSAAAAALFMTQPTLSKHIRRLEDELGVRLFSRDTHRVALTAAGRAILPDVEQIVESYRQIVRIAAKTGYSAETTLSLGYLHLMSLSHVYDRIRECHENIGGAGILMSVYYSADQMLEDLLRGELDLCTVILPDRSHLPHIRTCLLAQTDIRLILPDGHPLLGKEPVSLTDAARWPIIMPRHLISERIAEVFRKCLKQEGGSATIRMYDVTPETSLSLVERKEGIGICPDCFTIPAQFALKKAALPDSVPAVDIVAAIRSADPSPTAVAVFEALSP